MFAAAYRAAPGFAAPLREELARRGVAVACEHGPLLLTAAPPVPVAWALDVWLAPRLLPAPSVRAGADALRAIQRNWDGCQAAHHRRAALIAAKLPTLRPRALRFPEPAPSGHLGGWTLLEPALILASPSKTSPFLGGACVFEEDRAGPPSRAYLKFWEACTRLGPHPLPGETCLDLGAAPGGWSWAAARCGAAVIAVDKAPLAPAVAALPNVAWRQESAFAVDPYPVDWLLCDVAAYPARLLALVERWVAAGAARRILCTVKFQEPTDHDAAERFAAIPGGRLWHLASNRHELTFAWTRQDAAQAADAAAKEIPSGPSIG